jgi:hypothetical protein
LKKNAGTNTLAYIAQPSVMKETSFVSPVPEGGEKSPSIDRSRVETFNQRRKFETGLSKVCLNNLPYYLN